MKLPSDYIPTPRSRSQLQQALAAVLLALLLGGCVSQPEPESAPETEDAPAEVAAAEPAAAVKPPAPEDYPVAAFEGDTLYQLLVAEVAGYRGDYALALEKYLALALATRDAGVAARATRLAVYLKEDASALAASKVWAEVEPDSLDARRYAASQALRAGELEAAMVHMSAIKTLGGATNFDVFAYRAGELDASELKAMLGAIARMRELDPLDSQLKFSQAVLLEQSGELERALQITNELLEETDNVNVSILKVNILRNLQRNADALEFLESQAAVSKLNRRLQLIYARMLFEADRLNDARQQYEAVLESTPEDGDVLFAVALVSLELGEDTAAVDYLQRMVDLDLRAGEAHFYLGNLAEKRGEVGAAIEEYRQVGQGYEYLPAQARIAALLLAQDRLAEARRHLASERAAHPERARELIVLEAQFLGENNLDSEMFALLDEAVARRPDDIDLLYYRAMAGQARGRLDILERDLREIIRLDPSNADAMNALGYTLADQTERYEEALVLIERALAIKPNEAAFIDSLGWVQYRLGNYDAAIEQLRRALSLFQNDEVAAHLGEVLWVTGEQDEALEVWTRALELAPESAILRRVISQFTQ